MHSPLTIETRRRAYEEDPKWPAKAVLRVLAIVFALIAMPLFAVSIADTNSSYINTSGPGDWTDGLALAPVVLSLLYNPAALLLHFVVKKGQPAHPSIHVGLDLLVWGLSVPAIIFGVAGGMFWYWTPAVQSPDGTVDCSFFFNQWSMECSPAAYHIGRLEIAGLIFLFFLFITHLVLFIYACFDLHRRRLLVGNISTQNGFDMGWQKDPEQQSQRS